MTITIAVFYYLYLLVVLFFAIYSLFNIYHLLRFGFLSLVNIFVIIVYLVTASAFIIFSLQLLLTVNWQQPLLETGVWQEVLNKVKMP